jgi:tyrosine-protein kinase Etk/Wzc
LRANIYYSGPSKDDKVILITSPSPGDGKTLCTLSLAGALAADGKQVLVIEGDMHKPSHHLMFHQAQEPGLSSFLTRQVEWRHVTRVVETAHGSFDAITAGTIPPSPAELLSSPQFAAMVAHARRTYDFVLIDSPPFPVVSDALVISMYADRVLTVVRPQNTRRRAAEDHLRRFSASTPRYGVVINDVENRSSDVGYGYHSDVHIGTVDAPWLPRKQSEVVRRSSGS